MDKSKGFLFYTHDLRALLEHQTATMRQEVDRMEPNRLLNTSPGDLAKYLNDKFQISVPVLRRDQWSAREHEAQIDVRYDRLRFIRDDSRPALVPGQKIEVEIPFEGDAELFYAQASTSTLSPPRAVIRGNSIFLEYEMPNDAPRDVRGEIDATIAEIERHLAWIRNDTSPFNASLEANALLAVQQRRERILANQGRVASLGIPLKTRSDAAKTFAVPSVKKRIVPSLPPATTLPYVPEPTLEMGLYEHVIGVLQNMAHVMERSPSAFKTMGEEDLRQHFLVQLNGQFEGAATGETFNVTGKTDILLRAKDRNVFIAECKFWKGPKQFTAAIDQLLGYAAWRDTKTAILIFNRGTTLSTVLSAVDENAKKHPNYKETFGWTHESGFRYRFHHHNDLNRELVLTVLVFEVPA